MWGDFRFVVLESSQSVAGGRTTYHIEESCPIDRSRFIERGGIHFNLRNSSGGNGDQEFVLGLTHLDSE